MIGTVIAFFLGPVGRWVLVGGVSLLAIWGWGEKRYYAGRADYKAQLQEQINATIKQGTDAREHALGELNAGRVPDGWFRD